MENIALNHYSSTKTSKAGQNKRRFLLKNNLLVRWESETQTINPMVQQGMLLDQSQEW